MPPSPSVADLLAEKKRLEALLDASDDWRLLQQLEAYDDGGQADTPLVTDATRARLRLSLAENPFYQQRNRVLGALDRCRAKAADSDGAPSAKPAPQPGPASASAQTAPSSPQAGPAPPPARKVFADDEAIDDLTRIRGIDRNLARALNELGVLRFAQIRDWSAAEVAIVCCALKLGRRISAESWIEQAALLAADLSPARVGSDASREDAQNLPLDEPAQADTAQADTAQSDAAQPDTAPSRAAPSEFAMTASPPLPLVPSAYQSARAQACAPATPQTMSSTAQSDWPQHWPLPEPARVPRPMTCSGFPAIVIDSPEFDQAAVDAAADPFGANYSDDGHVNLICVRAVDWETEADETDEVAASQQRRVGANEPEIGTPDPQPAAGRHVAALEVAASDTVTPDTVTLGAGVATPAKPPPPAAQPAPLERHHAGGTARPIRRVRAPVLVRQAAIGQSSTEASVEIIRRAPEPTTAAIDASATGESGKPLARLVSRLLKGRR